jgi:hypothetical protein
MDRNIGYFGSNRMASEQVTADQRFYDYGPPPPPKLLCRLFGHKWTFTHVLREGDRYSHKAVWVYYSHMCKRCYLEERRSLWPSN